MDSTIRKNAQHLLGKFPRIKEEQNASDERRLKQPQPLHNSYARSGVNNPRSLERQIQTEKPSMFITNNSLIERTQPRPSKRGTNLRDNKQTFKNFGV